MSQNIKKQLENVVHGCASPYHSKRADKFNHAIDTAWKIYANSSFDDMLDLAKNLGKYVREHYPDKTKAYQIDRNIIQAYMNSKTAQWAQDTPIPMEAARLILADMKENRSETVNAATLSVYLGMRAKETTCLTVENVHFTKGEFNLGWVQIVKGPAGGAKGGKPRRIPIMDQEAQDALRTIVAGKNPGNYVAAKEPDKNGKTKLEPDTVESAIREALKARFGDTYLYNDGHGMRKTFAQRYYDVIREKNDRDKTIAKTNAVLGHGYNRGPQGIKTYVKNMH